MCIYIYIYITSFLLYIRETTTVETNNQESLQHIEDFYVNVKTLCCKLSCLSYVRPASLPKMNSRTRGCLAALVVPPTEGPLERHIHTHTYVQHNTHTYTHTCMHTHIHTFIHTYIHTYIAPALADRRVLTCVDICIHL